MSPLKFEVQVNGERNFITVVEAFIHYYTNELMRYIRIDSFEPYSVIAQSEYVVVNESDFNKLLELQVKETDDEKE